MHITISENRFRELSEEEINSVSGGFVPQIIGAAAGGVGGFLAR